MKIDRMKKGAIKRCLKKAVIAVALIIFLIVYFEIFFAKGIFYDDVFLKRLEVSESEISYSGISAYGDINISVKSLEEDGVVWVIYSLPNKIYEQYAVQFSNSTNGYDHKRVVIKKDEEIIFEGDYNKKSSFLIDENGEAFFNANDIIYITGDNPYFSGYQIALKNVADLAFFANDTILGRIEFLIFAVVLFGITLFDMRFPAFFFTMKHLLDVRNPEPSVFYIYMQKFTWILYPIVGICFMLYAIISRFV